MTYTSISVKLTPAQKKRIREFCDKKVNKDGKPSLNIRLTKHQLEGIDQLHLPTMQAKKIEKARDKGTGCTVNISRTCADRMRKGGFLATLGKVIAPMVLESATNTLNAPSAGQDRIRARLAQLRGMGLQEAKKTPFAEGAELGKQMRGKPPGRATMQNLQKMAESSDLVGSGFLKDLWEGFKFGVNPKNFFDSIELLVGEADQAIQKRKARKAQGNGVQFY